jgi:hypothetical protein
MGLAFTIDSPIRVANYGIDSVISIMDDELIERMNAFYSEKFQLPYQEISKKVHDYRAKRITAYLDLVDSIVKKKFESFKAELTESKENLQDFISMLPGSSDLRTGLEQMISEGIACKTRLMEFIEKNFLHGSIDVNIMTKLDKDNFAGKEQLPVEFNDAHAALRGFANSKLESSVVLSAGMNPRLFSYFEQFQDFFPNAKNELKKKIILKVSDFRSAMIQGSFLAKKGLWVSEYRIESGLNCGGHAFATDGYLLGPIMEEFKQKKSQLIEAAYGLWAKALELKGNPVPEQPLNLKITVQGGVGTAEEHEFLLSHYQADSVGWGTPFLLVPEATSVDADTRRLLIDAEEDDFYLSPLSPLGVPFNTVRGTTNEAIRAERLQEQDAGSSCPKRFLALSKEYDNKGVCTASRKYQEIKISELEEQRSALRESVFLRKVEMIREKACLCVGLANAAYLENNITVKGQDHGVVICPGPNMAYFSKEVSLKEMVQHIYGGTPVMTDKNRPNMFIKELGMYVDYLKNEIGNMEFHNNNQYKKLRTFQTNLLEGIAYYKNMFGELGLFRTGRKQIEEQLSSFEKEVESISLEVAV